MSLLSRIGNLLHGDRHAQELADELACHVDLRTEENIERGMCPDEARAEAIRAFGNRSVLFERARDFDVPRWLDSLAHDFRYCLRALRSARAESSLLILSLALGIGANTAIFTLLYGVVNRPLPVQDPGTLYSVTLGNFCAYGWVEGDRVMNYALWKDLREQQNEFSGLFAYAPVTLDLSRGGQIRLISGAYATSDMWGVLRVNPIVGRTFTKADEKLGATSAVAVISDSLWESEYGRSPDSVGHVIVIGGRPFTIIGVAPRTFFGIFVGNRADVFLPLEASAWLEAPVNPLANGSRWWLLAMGRLRPGTTAETAGQHLAAMSPTSMQRTIPADWPKHENAIYLRQKFEIQSARTGFSEVRSTLTRPLVVATGLVAALLLLACANIATLQLSRGISRRREFAIRIALGVSRSRLAMQVFQESLIAGAAGAALGILLSYPTARMLTTLYSTEFSALQLELRPDFYVLAFTAGVAVLTTMLFGVAPAVQAIRTDPNQSLKSTRAPGSVQPLQRLLLGVQVCLAVVLMAGATMFAATLRDLLRQDLGIQASNVLLMQMETQRAGLGEQDRAAFYFRAKERLESIPGVDSVAISYVTPLSGSTWQANIKIAEPSGERASHAFFNIVSPDFFRTYSTPVLEGRPITRQDRMGSPQVVVVNREFMKSVLRDNNIAGRRIRADTGAAMHLNSEIVGIVADAKYRDLRAPAPPTIYVPMAQDPTPPQAVAIAIRTRTAVQEVTPAVRRIMTELNPKVAFLMRPLEQQVSDSLVNERAIAAVAGLFGALALVLAAVGIYGLAAYSVMRRRAEIGIRMALGATAGRVITALFGQTVTVVIAGVLAGALIAAWSARFADALFFGVTANSIWVYVVSATALVLTSGLAILGPSARAMSLDPARTLRSEE